VIEDALPPDGRATGAWLPGDPVGARRFADVGPLDLELGGRLPSVRLAYETWGSLAPDRANAVLVLHALTGDAHVVGESGPGQPTAGWWPRLIGPGAAVDTDKWFVVAANMLGGCQGSTGPSSADPDGRPWGSRFPRVTVADQVRAEALLANVLGIDVWASVVGGSMGGMRALEWLVGHPARVRSGLLLATGAAVSADQLGTQSAQVRAIESDPAWRGGDYYDHPPGPVAGMGVARRIAHLTYRCADELETRFGRSPQDGEKPLGPRRADGRFAVESYLDHHAAKLARRFDAGTYVALTDSMSTWDVGRGRGGVDAALAGVTAPTLVAGIDSDRLYPIALQEQLASAIPGTLGGLRTVHSLFGHDGFLIEVEHVAALVAELLAQLDIPVLRPERPAPAGCILP
jgi:homoserine O-acetyltransferase/O-succinyltransferase